MGTGNEIRHGQKIDQTDIDTLKSFVAEWRHEGSYNIKEAVKGEGGFSMAGIMTMKPPISIKAIAEARISKTLAKVLREVKSKKMLFPWRTKPVLFDLSDMDLDDALLAELFEACTGRNKELAHIDYIDLSGNPRLTKLSGHLAWCTGLWELELGDTAIAALPDWVHGLKNITVHKRDEVLFKAVLPMPPGPPTPFGCHRSTTILVAYGFQRQRPSHREEEFA